MLRYRLHRIHSVNSMFSRVRDGQWAMITAAGVLRQVLRRLIDYCHSHSRDMLSPHPKPNFEYFNSGGPPCTFSTSSASEFEVIKKKPMNIAFIHENLCSRPSTIQFVPIYCVLVCSNGNCDHTISRWTIAAHSFVVCRFQKQINRTVSIRVYFTHFQNAL